MTIPRELAFEVSEFRTRLAAIQGQMEAREIDALLLFGPQNINYVAGLDNDNLSDVQCVIVPADRDPILVLFWFEAGRAENTSWLEDVILYRDGDGLDAVVQAVARLGLTAGRLGVERPSVGLTIGGYERLIALLPNATVVDPHGVVEVPRRVKSPAEISYMRRAAALTDAAVDAACQAMHVGMRDGELAAIIAGTVYGGGGETMCLGPIVASGFRAGAPHSSFNGRRLQEGDSVFLEFTAQVRRYTAPIMRTVWLGEPPAAVARIADAGAAAVATVIEMSRPGTPAGDVAREALRPLEPVLSDLMFHQTFGYPVGIGYPPTWVESLGFLIREENDQPLAAGMTFHLPISLRKFGTFGVNQSHTMLVTENGAESLTKSTARLLVLDGAAVP